MRTPFRVLGTAGRTALKFGMWLETHYFGILQKLTVGHRGTCLRAHPFSVSREWFYGFVLKLGVWLGDRQLCVWRRMGMFARAHVLTVGYICLATQKSCFWHLIAAELQNATATQLAEFSTKILIQALMLPDCIV